MEFINLDTYKIAKDFDLNLSSNKQIIINTINAHSWVTANKDKNFKRALKESSVLLPDGISIVLAAKILRSQKIKKIAGADLHYMILNKMNKSAGKCFYLGSSVDTLNKIEKKLSTEYPNVKVRTMSPPFKNEFTEKENQSMIDQINAFAPDVLFVGMTAPKQEKWIYENRSKINAKVITAIGAVFDFYAETKKRPSQFMINTGFEWLGRLISDPHRLWKRYLINNPIFVYQIIKLKLDDK